MANVSNKINVKLDNNQFEEVQISYIKKDGRQQEGIDTQAIGEASHSEGRLTTASGANSHAEGIRTVASGKCSHAEGGSTTASGNISHAEGGSTTASGNISHAEGRQTIASGDHSHAEGSHTQAIGTASHAGGFYTIASADYQTAIGRYNINDTNNQYAFIIGKGTADEDRSNAMTVNWDGDIDIARNLQTQGTIVCNKSIYTGQKRDNLDGLEGIRIGQNGRIYLGGTEYSPGIYFYYNSTSANATITYTDGQLRFNGPSRFTFTGSIYANNNLIIGYNGGTYDLESTFSIKGYWSGGRLQSIISRLAGGTTLSLGWSGDAEVHTVTQLRGKSVKTMDCSGVNASSDERLKYDFISLDAWENFFDQIQPYGFKYKIDDSEHYHLGFKAQQIEQALLNNNLSTQDFAGLIKTEYTPDTDDDNRNAIYQQAGIKPGDDEYGLIYTEFTALNTYQIQKLKTKCKKQEIELQELKTKLEQIEKKINS